MDIPPTGDPVTPAQTNWPINNEILADLTKELAAGGPLSAEDAEWLVGAANALSIALDDVEGAAAPPARNVLESIGFQGVLGQLKNAAGQLEMFDPVVLDALVVHLNGLKAEHELAGNTQAIDEITIEVAILTAVRHFKSEMKTIAERAAARAALRLPTPTPLQVGA